MPLRRRISIIAAATVAIAVAIAVLASYFIVRGKLVGQIDNELRAQAQLAENGDLGALGPHTQLPGNTANGGAYAPYVQYVRTDGQRYTAQGDLYLPSGAPIRAVANGTSPAQLSTVTVNGYRLRMLVFRSSAHPTNNPYETFPIAVELARPLGPVASILNSL